MKPTNRSHLASIFNRRRRNEAGFTLLEIIISMFIIGLLAVAALPLMMHSMQITSQNTTATAANQRILQTIEEARVVPITCVRLQSMVGTKSYSDGRGNNYTVALSLPSGCTVTANAQTATIRLVARKSSNNRILTDLTTKVFVPGTAV